MASTVCKKKPILSLYYDIVSPYAWVAFESLIRYEQYLDIELDLLPVSIGAMFRETKTLPNVKQSPQKALHMHRDLKLVGTYWGIPLNPPKDFDKSLVNGATLNPQRFLTALDVHRKGLLRPVSRELWQRSWSRDEPVYDWDSIRQVCDKLNIPRDDQDQLISACSTEAIKELLKKRTNEALSQQACGLPWLVLRREGHQDLFVWGSDRLPMLCDLLGKPFVGPMRDENSKL